MGAFLNNMGAVMKIDPIINIRESSGQQEEKYENMSCADFTE